MTESQHRAFAEAQQKVLARARKESPDLAEIMVAPAVRRALAWADSVMVKAPSRSLRPLKCGGKTGWGCCSEKDC